MVPIDYFEDEISKGIAIGAFNHLKYNRFNITNVKLGYGKTIISILAAMEQAKCFGNDIQLAIIATKSKRLDNSFQELLDSAEEYYGVRFSILYINGEMIGTFTGFNRMIADKNGYKVLVDRILDKPTLFILDETHMNLRDPTTKTSKGFKKLFDKIEKEKGFVRALGLTATPVDTSIIDCIGYLVFNGEYNSKTEFYKKEIIGFSNARSRGLTIRDAENMIVDRDYRINKRMFLDISSVVKKIAKIIYRPLAPKNFYIPPNKIIDVPISLTETTYKRIDHLVKLESQRAFSNETTKKREYLEAYAADDFVVKKILELVKDKETKQPIIFYQRNSQRDILRKMFSDHSIAYSEINGESHSYYDNLNKKMKEPIIVQFRSGATAFESKESNTSIYFSLPESSIEFEQTLGRNARRNQDFDEIKNYLLMPVDREGKMISQFEDDYNRIKNKTERNLMFLKTFETDWGVYGESLQAQ